MNPFTKNKNLAYRIVKHTAETAGQPYSKVIGYDRSQKSFIPRAIAMWLIRQNTDLTLNDIGELFLGRDHTTVLNALKRAELLLEASPEVRAACNQIMRDAKEEPF